MGQGQRSRSNFWRAAVDIRGSALPSAAKSKEELLPVQSVCLCACNRWAYADYRADAVDRLFYLIKHELQAVTAAQIWSSGKCMHVYACVCTRSVRSMPMMMNKPKGGMPTPKCMAAKILSTLLHTTCTITYPQLGLN